MDFMPSKTPLRMVSPFVVTALNLKYLQTFKNMCLYACLNRQSDRRDRGKKVFNSLTYSTNTIVGAGLGQGQEAGTASGSSWFIAGILVCPELRSKYINRKLVHKRRSQDLIPGTPTWSVVVPSGGLTCCIKTFATKSF